MEGHLNQAHKVPNTSSRRFGTKLSYIDGDDLPRGKLIVNHYIFENFQILPLRLRLIIATENSIKSANTAGRIALTTGKESMFALLGLISLIFD